MAYQIDVSPDAVTDIDAAFEYIARDSRVRAQKWLNGLQASIESLDRNPERCPLAPESAAFEVELRQLLFGNRRGAYRILFTISRRTVQVVRILHAARRNLDE
ncbi:MAG TPA: type II toxin-antitoxin system RelE/ParE family toxin [Planctomycetaceae bacterium]|nr:type II toxin-antitoxin system RelE/ParE family toxin [Planctomycetaceae bacterium]